MVMLYLVPLFPITKRQKKAGKSKKYCINNLLDNYDDILKRCHLIEKILSSVSFIPNTQISIDHE